MKTPLSLLLLLASCALSRMNENMAESNASIQENTQMIEESTSIIQENTQEVKRSTEAMQQFQGSTSAIKEGLPFILSAVAIFLLAPALILFVSCKKILAKLDTLLNRKEK
jgi:hypothetical protein